jgi:hypothetical protein
VKTVTVKILLPEAAVKAAVNLTRASCYYKMRTARVVRTVTYRLGAETLLAVVLVIILQAGGTTTIPQVLLITIRVSITIIAMPVVVQVVSLVASVVPSRRW